MAGPRASHKFRNAFVGVASLAMVVATVVPGPTANVVAAPAPSAVPRNFALGAATRQSSTREPGIGDSAKAVDGSHDGKWHSTNYLDQSISETAREANPWWEADLGSPQFLTELKIWNRNAPESAYLSDFWVFVSSKPFTSNDPNVVAADPSVTAMHFTSPPKPTLSIPVQTLARYVRVQVPGVGIVSLAEVEAFGPAGLQNFAAFGSATQSSTSYGGSPGKAVDGDAAGAHRGRSVSHTASEKNAWWQIDLGVHRTVSEVRVWNRTDCCSERLSDFYVFASDQPFASADPAVLARDQNVATTRITSRPDPMVSIPLNRTARYVRVQLAGSNFLSLAEVEVVGPEPRNYAPGGVATQSSTSYGGIAEYAQDNNRIGKHKDRTVSHTAREQQPWWQVDLGASKPLNEVRVWNRIDCCSERLSEFYVFASDQPFASNDPAVLAQDPNVTTSRITSQPNPAVSIPLERTARYVRVQLAGTNYLSLGEVEVLGPEVLQRPDPEAWIDDHDFGMFVCYGMSTFDDRQWATPNTPVDRFDPGQGNPDHVVDTDAWLEAAKSAGMDYAILTAKHHEGFALWPTKYSDYSIASSPYQGGNGDIVADYIDSVDKAGLKPALYFSIWDRTNIETTALAKNQIRELLTNYGEIDYLWLDGYGRRVRQGTVPWNDLRDFIHQVSPNTIVGVNNRQYNPALSDLAVRENSYPVWSPVDIGLPLDIAHPMDADGRTYYYTSLTGEPLSADNINQNRTTMASRDVTYSLGIGPRKDGTLDPRYVDRLREVGERYPG